MSGDDEIIIRNKITKALTKALPNAKLWHFIATAAAAFIVGALVF